MLWFGFSPYRISKVDLPFINSLGPFVKSFLNSVKLKDNVVFTASRSAVKGSEKEKDTLSYAATVDNGDKVAVIKPEKLAEAKKVYSAYLYGYFVGKDLPIGMVRYHLYKMWKKFGIMDISTNNNGIFFFKFRNKVGMINAVEKGPWLVNDIPLCIKKWEAGICLEKIEPSVIPLWVTIPNLSLELWNSESICSMLSCIGKPILFDKITTERCGLKEGPPGFARVLVEVGADNVLPEFVKAYYPEDDGNPAFIKEVRVAYQIKVKKCSVCKVFRHDFEACTKRILSEDEFSIKAMKLLNEIKKAGDQTLPVSGKGNMYKRVQGGGNKMGNAGSSGRVNSGGASTSGVKNDKGESISQKSGPKGEHVKSSTGIRKGGVGNVVKQEYRVKSQGAGNAKKGGISGENIVKVENRFEVLGKENMGGGR
ncbi:uncharacterized protein LOC118480179 [Helianthus annuus]|uniref:uncharacterized protein LOC118480179 n=1 Tax=Helianthus annuus TaxID=4232 RepID=UPI001652B88C|nr:uncharacterized protein LOC118480179 [Helianthus annuus]